MFCRKTATLQCAESCQLMKFWGSRAPLAAGLNWISVEIIIYICILMLGSRLSQTTLRLLQQVLAAVSERIDDWKACIDHLIIHTPN